MTTTTTPATDVEPPRRRTRRLAPLVLAVALTSAALTLVAGGAPAGADDTEVQGVIERDDQPGTAIGPQAKVDWGIISGTVYFNMAETSTIAATAPYGAAVCGAIGRLGTTGAVLGSVCAIKAAEWVWVANVAKNQTKCLKIKVGVGYAGAPGYVYSGGYCTK